MNEERRFGGLTMIKSALIAGALSVAGLAAYGWHQMMEPNHWGKTIDEAFSDPRLAELTHAACKGDASQVAALIKSGTPIDGRGYKSFTPLNWALACKCLTGMEALLKGGANPNQHNIGEGLGEYSPLELAVDSRDPAYLKLLLKYNADPSWRNDRGEPILFRAFAFAHNENIEYWDNYYALIKAGADINVPAGHTGIAETAVYDGYPSKAIELLIRGYKYDLERLALTVYGSNMGEDDPEYPNLGVLARMLRERGVDTEKAKARVIAQDKDVGSITHDFAFERLRPEGAGTAR